MAAEMDKSVNNNGGIDKVLERTLQGMADITFLALAIWREARNQSRECQVAVAYTILNRVKNPKWWGSDICSVLFKRYQYSSLTLPSDPQLVVWPDSADVSWKQCLDVASKTIAGLSENIVAGADSFYDISIPAPCWAKPILFVRQIGHIRFYNVDGDRDYTST